MINFLIKYKMTIFFIALITILALASPVGAGSICNESYEDYSIGSKNFFSNTNPDLWRPNNPPNSQTYYEIVGNPTRSGGKAMKFQNYRESASSGYRMEHILQEEPGDGAYNFLPGNEYWIGFSIYLPEDFVCDGCDSGVYANEIHMQLKGLPDSGESTSLNPPVAFQINADKWILLIRADSNANTVKPNYERSVQYDMGSWLEDKGQWTDWVFHFKADYTRDGNNGGFMKVYKNGTLVVNDIGGNCYNDERGSFLAIGTYRFSWKSGSTDTDTRILYFDEVKVGDKNSNFSEVSPNGTSSLTTTLLNAPTGLTIFSSQ